MRLGLSLSGRSSRSSPRDRDDYFSDVRHTLVAAWYEALWSVYIVGYLFRLEFSVTRTCASFDFAAVLCSMQNALRGLATALGFDLANM